MGSITDWIANNVDPRQIVDDAGKVVNWFDPARPFNQQAAGLRQGADDAKALASLQWAREMEGLSRALGYGAHSQGVLNSVYATRSGPALPISMLPQAPPAPGPAPGPPAPAVGPPGVVQPTGGLGRYFPNASGPISRPGGRQ